MDAVTATVQTCGNRDNMSNTLQEIYLEYPHYRYGQGRHCAKCGDSFEQGQPVVWQWPSYDGPNSVWAGYDRRTLHIETCIKPRCSEDLIKRCNIHTCSVCGRTVYTAAKFKGVCSERCRNTKAKRLQRDIKKLATALYSGDIHKCAVCSTQFTPKRTDSRYCSNKCRQKAYRQRTHPA